MTVPETQQRTLDGRNEYVMALDELCGLAQQSLCIFDKNFDQSGFNSEARYDVLRRFLQAERNASLLLLAHDLQPLLKFCPRIMNLQRQFSHAVEIHQTSINMRQFSAPFAVADTQHLLRRFHFNDSRGLWVKNEPLEAAAWKSRFNEMWVSSQAPVTLSGLGL